MTHIVIYHDALSHLDMANLREFNREHNPVIITVVMPDGYSNRYKLTEPLVDYIIGHVPEHYTIKR